MSKTRNILIILIASVLAAAMGVLLGFSSFWFNVKGNPTSTYTIEQMSIPYWYNTDGTETTVYNEIVTPIRYGSNANAVGYLTYTPTEIISVQSYDLGTTYDSSMYTISGNQISFAVGNGMPYVQEEWLDNKNVPDQYNDGSLVSAKYNDGGGKNNGAHVVAENALTRTTYLAVTYKFSSGEDLGFTPQSFQPENYPNLLKKLNAGQPVKILVFGDSISVGASASAFSGFAPYTPTWFDQIKNFLVARYYNGDASKVTLVNPSVGGTTSAWGVKQTLQSAYDKSGYDLVIVGFGMNDGSAQNNPAIFKSNIAQIITELRAYSPNADYIILGSFTPNPLSIFAGNHSSYVSVMQDLANSLNIISGDGYQSGCTYISLYDVSVSILNKKQANNSVGDTRYQYMDISANYTNHPNDFMVRLYAGSILSSFIDFSN